MVRSVAREVRDLDKEVSNIQQGLDGSFNPSADPGITCSLLVNHLCMRRNKRCLLAYHRTRSDKIEEMVWSGSDIVEQAAMMNQREAINGQNPSTDLGNDQGNSSSLSPEEEEYARQYSDLLAAYKGQWTDVDLTGSLEPPRDLFIDVRVLKDAGEIQTEYGCVKEYFYDNWYDADNSLRAITLTKNSQFYVRQGDVERLIAQGYLQKLS